MLITTPMAATMMIVMPEGCAGSKRRLMASQPIAPTAPISNKPLMTDAKMVAREYP